MSHGPSERDWIATNLGGLPWGMLLRSPAGLQEVRTHLRRLLSVRSLNGEIWYFRLYDPRVLPPFLAASTPAEVARVFGPIQAFVLPAPKDGPSIELRPGPPPGETDKIRVRLSGPMRIP